MWKNLNKILHDKNDYHLDPSLKNDVEISDELLQATLRIQKNLILRIIKYFFQYDKLFFLRLFAKYFLRLLILIIGIGTVAYILLLTFGIDINLKKIPKANYSEFPIYIESAGDEKIDSINVASYKKLYGRDIKYFLFFPKDSSKDYKMWKEKLSGIESNGVYDARREGSQYWGKYQMGESARKSINLHTITWEKWKNNPELQEAALRLWIDFLYQELKDDIRKFDGLFLNGWSITESGIIAMAHNVGFTPLREFLYSNGKKVPKDGSGKDATRFLILGNYDLEFKK